MKPAFSSFKVHKSIFFVNSTGKVFTSNAFAVSRSEKVSLKNLSCGLSIAYQKMAFCI